LTIWQNNNVKLATWECKLDNVDLKIQQCETGIGKFNLGNTNFEIWQNGVGKEEK
jgi:hypothetical protein